MSEIIQAKEILPLPQANVTIREATEADVPFIDSLQKLHRKQVGFMPEGQILAKIKARDVLIAEVEDGESKMEDGENPSSILHPPSSRIPVGYCVGQDRYFKHDDVGIIYQLNVVPGKQRGFIGANL